MTINELFISIVRNEVFGSANMEFDFSDGMILESLYAISNKHDMAHIVADFLEKRGITSPKFAKQKLLAVYRREQLDYEESSVAKLFEEEKIDYILLKGAELKKRYPLPFMRTSSDVDILIRPENRESAIAFLKEKRGYVLDTEAERDCSFLSKSGMNIELHFGITCDDKKLDRVLSRAWDLAASQGGHKYIFCDEFFVFYHVAHMQTHFCEGGCGVRSFVDLALLRDIVNIDKLYPLLDEAENRSFFEGVYALSNAWFGNSEHNDLTRSIAEYVLKGGVYGTRSNLGATGRHKNGSYFGYIKNRIFMPTSKLKLVYPKIEKHPVLIPYYQVKRWFSLLDKDKRNSARNELKGDKGHNEVDIMLTELGL